MGNNKLLNAILSNIDELAYTINSDKSRRVYYSSEFYYELILKLELWCKLIAKSTEDSDLNYIIERLKKIKMLTEPTNPLNRCEDFIRRIQDTIEACEKRRESIFLGELKNI